MNDSLTALFRREFALCKLRPEETVAIVGEIGCKQEYADAAAAAAADLGAAVLVATTTGLSQPTLPPFGHQADPRQIEALIAATEKADFVVDVTVGGIIHSNVRTQILGKGKRMLFVAEPPVVLGRLFPTDALRAAVDRAGDAIARGAALRVRSAAGTDLVADISGDIPITRQYGYTDTPGRWDHWPSGFVACFPHDRSAQGTIVLQPGDALIPFNRYVRNAITLDVRDGFITAIHGDGADAFLLEDYFRRWDDPNVYALSHMGWGVHPHASWAAFDVYDPMTLYGQELRSVSGNFMWSTGSNRFANRETPAHLDIPMRGCTVSVDDTVVVAEGDLCANGSA